MSVEGLIELDMLGCVQRDGGGGPGVSGRIELITGFGGTCSWFEYEKVSVIVVTYEWQLSCASFIQRNFLR